MPWEKFNLKTTCIYNPLDKNDIIEKSKIRSKIKFKRKGLNIINVGRYTDQKDQITLLKALNIIKKKLILAYILLEEEKKRWDF